MKFQTWLKMFNFLKRANGDAEVSSDDEEDVPLNDEEKVVEEEYLFLNSKNYYKKHLH